MSDDEVCGDCVVSRHPRCHYDGPHTAHDFVTYVDDAPTLEPPPVMSDTLTTVWCPGEPEPTYDGLTRVQFGAAVDAATP